MRIRDRFIKTEARVAPYAFVSPFFIVFAIFGFFPLVYTAWVSLHDWSLLAGDQGYVGFANYRELMHDTDFWRALTNTVGIFLLATIPQLIIALLLAFIINTPYVKGKDFFRAAFFAPNVAAAVAVSLIFTSLLGARYGMLNYALGFFGLGPIDWLGSAAWLKPSIAMVTIWQWTGYSMIIYLAGLQSINPELYEAARVDGAQTRDIFRHITLPLLRPVIVFQVILSIIGAMQSFDIPVMLAGGTQSSAPGGTDRAGLTGVVLIYWTAFKYTSFGYASAMAFTLFILIIGFTLIYNRFQGRNPTE